MNPEVPPDRGPADAARRAGGPAAGRGAHGARGLVAGGAAVLAVLVVLAAAAVFAGKDVLVRKVLEARLHRSVTFARLSVGRGDGGLLRLTFSDLRIGQPPRFGAGDLARVPSLELTVRAAPLLVGRLEAPEVVLTAPELHLRRRGRRDDNWTFGRRGGASSLLAATRRLEIRDGRVRMDDTALGLGLQAAVSHAPSDPDMPLRLEGGGVLGGQPFRVSARGGPLNGRRRGSPHRIDVSLADGATHVRLQGASRAPFDFRGLDAEVAADGPNLADLTHLFKLATPNSPTYRLTAHIHRAGPVFETSRIAAHIGDSDVEGRVLSERRGRRVLTAVLRSRRLTAHDLRILLASPPPHAVTRDTPGVSGGGTRPGRVFSEAPLSVRRLGEVEATLDYRVETATGFGPPVSDARLRMKLAGGRLGVAPLTFATACGSVRADFVLDATAGPPTATLGLRARGLQVARLHGPSGFSGVLDADLDLRGSGASLARQAAALGGDVFGLLAGALDPAARAPLRCAAADFAVRGGVAEATRLVVATGGGTASGGGRIDLGRERVDLTLKASPGGGPLLKLRTPITLSGPLARPRVSAKLAAAEPRVAGGLSGVVGALRRMVGRAPPPPPPPPAC